MPIVMEEFNISSSNDSNFYVSTVNPFIDNFDLGTNAVKNSTGGLDFSKSDYIYILFADPNGSYSLHCPNSGTIYYTVVGGGAGGGSYSGSTSQFYVGGNSGAVAAGSFEISSDNDFFLNVGSGGSGGNNNGSEATTGGLSSIFYGVDKNNITNLITCGGGSYNSVGNVDANLTSLSNSLSYKSNNITNFGIGATGGYISTPTNSGPGINIIMNDSNSFYFGGGGGSGVDFEDGTEGEGPVINATSGSDGNGGEGGTSYSIDRNDGNGGGGGGGGSIISVNTTLTTGTEGIDLFSSATNGGDATKQLSGDGGIAGIGGGGGGCGDGITENPNSGGKGGNGLIMLYFQQTEYVTSNVAVEAKKVSTDNLTLIAPTSNNNFNFSVQDNNMSHYLLHIRPTEKKIGIFLGNNDLSGGLSAPYDIDLQMNMNRIKGSLPRIRSLTPATFTIDHVSQQIGFISQDIEPFFPNIVKDGPYNNQLRRPVKGVNMTQLTPYLVDAIQELANKVDEQEKKIKELEKKQNNENNTIKGLIAFNIASTIKKLLNY
jgi:hypothetical protein